MNKIKLSCVLLVLLVCGNAPANEYNYEVFAVLLSGCPMAKLYANRLNKLAAEYPEVHFEGISADPNDEDISDLQDKLSFSFRSNPEVINRLGATRSPEVFLLVDGQVVYQGRIDDQYNPGTNRSEPTRCDLEEAIKETLAGKPVSEPKTVATGCHIPTDQKPRGQITFDAVAPILYKRCTECHRPGEVGPFSLLTYEDAKSWKDMIREVVSNNRMPPWHADPKHGKFANDRSLTADEKSTLLAWIDNGSPQGDNVPVPPTFKSGWSITPDVVLRVEKPFTVPAEGVLDYQEFILDPGFTSDTWIQALEVRPGVSAVVHHVNVFVRPKDAEKGLFYSNDMQDGYVATAVPGNTATSWPAGIAKVIPAGWQVVLSVHYQPNGSVQQDRSSIAFQLAGTVKQRAATRVFLKEDLRIEPNTVTEATQDWTTEEDLTLIALYPHMHLRGRSMRFEVVGGPVLLDVPHFDFNWQHRYVLAEPINLPKGTHIRCTAVFDNTASNPNNPDPNAVVTHGQQSSDEMFQSCFEVVRTHEDLTRRHLTPWPVLVVVLAAMLFLIKANKQ